MIPKGSSRVFCLVKGATPGAVVGVLSLGWVIGRWSMSRGGRARGCGWPVIAASAVATSALRDGCTAVRSGVDLDSDAAY